MSELRWSKWIRRPAGGTGEVLDYFLAAYDGRIEWRIVGPCRDMTAEDEKLPKFPDDTLWLGPLPGPETYDESSDEWPENNEW